jgi:hypothetical protein
MIEALYGVGGTLIVGLITWAISKLVKKGKEVLTDNPATIKTILSILEEQERKREAATSRAAARDEMMVTVFDKHGDAIGSLCACVCNGNKDEALASLKESREVTRKYLIAAAGGV